MEISTKPQGRENPINPSPTNFPHSNESSHINISNGAVLQIHSPNLRSETSPYPTTFVQADTSNFKQVVQMLTGSSETAKQASNSKPNQQDPPSSSRNLIPPIKTTAPKKQSCKLYERRNQLKNSLMINTFIPGFAPASGFSPIRKTEIMSPSMLDFPKLALSSPVTPLNENGDPLNKSSPSLGNSSEEEKAIAEKGFYLHPSPRTTPRDSEPQLLPLFPVESPRLPGSSSS